MVDRDFTEIDLRSMLQATTRLRRDIERGRWVAITRLGADRWEVVLEPDQAEERVVVIRLASRTMTDSNSSYLEVTFRHGRALAAYLFLPRHEHDRSAKSRRVEPGLVIDFSRDGRPIGIEITAPSRVTLTAINGVLRSLGAATLTRADLAPQRAA